MASLIPCIRKQKDRNTVEKPLKSTFINYRGMKFLITKRPGKSNIQSYIEELQRYNVDTLVTTCHVSFDLKHLERAGIMTYKLRHREGVEPPNEAVARWLAIAQCHYDVFPNRCLAIQCVEGLGRASVMVALSLMELGLSNKKAIKAIRKRRPGAFNQCQLEFLEGYQPRFRLRVTGGVTLLTDCFMA